MSIKRPWGIQTFCNGCKAEYPGGIATIYVNEMRMDPSFLNAFSVNDIAMIKVIKGPFAGAIGNGGGGVVAIYTMKADDKEEEEHSK